MENMWIQAARQGDEEAITQLVTTYQQPIYALCYRMLGERTEAEDAAQEALIKALTNLDKFDAERPFRPWMYRIAANECTDRLRRRRPIASLDDMGEDDAWEWYAGCSPNPERELVAQERTAEVQLLLEQLAPEDRMVVTLFYWESLSYQEISQITGMTISAIKSRLFRARRALARQLVEEEIYA
ncbi:MAG TPA: sigma-70 family RNA polymerase sigma factor [Chloroflexi bacterium]|nr:sigma-70 family RNA polymerase sigma factor [Chloroflexota bacterium]